MVTEARWQNRQPEFGLPAGVYSRQAWRPPGLRRVESLLSGIASRNETLGRHRARLTAWYEQFVRRSQPFIGWQPLATGEFEVDNPQSSFGSTESVHRTSQAEWQMISKDLPPVTHVVSSVAQDRPLARHPHRFPAEPQGPPRTLLLRRSISGAESMPSSGSGGVPDLSESPETPIKGVGQPVALPGHEATSTNPVAPPRSAEDRRLAAQDGRLAAEDSGRISSMAAPPQPREEQAFVRPAMRLAILRPIITATGTMRQNEAGPMSSDISRFSPAATTDFTRLEHLPGGEQPAFQPRLASSVSSFPRQEVRGGFPASPRTEVRRDAETSSSDFVRASVRDTSVFENHALPETTSSARSRQVEIPEPPAVIPPVALPGLQIRLLKPDEPPSATQRSANSAAEGGRSTSEAPRAQALPPAAPPPLDINAVADKVYQVLQRRHQLERERRGLY